MSKGAVAAILLLAAAWAAAGNPAVAGDPFVADVRDASPAKSRLSLSGAWALYPLAVRWREEFQKTHPGTVVDVQAGGAGKGIADALAGIVDVGMVSRKIYPAETARGAVAVAVARDAVVATLNAKNPHLVELLRSGLKREDFAALWMSGSVKSWEALLAREVKSAPTPAHVFTRSDACGAAETWASYLGGHQEDLAGVGVYGDPGLAEAVRRDPLAIGYGNVNYAYDAKTRMPISGLAICPIDLDGNGRVDPAERIYATREDLIRAIAAGIYPSPPARDLYFVIKGRPPRPALAEFLVWVLTDGQKYVSEMGYVAIGPDRLATGLAALRASTEER